MSWLPKSPKARRRLWVLAAVAPVLAAAVGKFSLLRFGLAGVLIFIGLKMTWLNPFPISWSLAIIASLLGGSILASWMVDKRKERLSKA